MKKQEEIFAKLEKVVNEENLKLIKEIIGAEPKSPELKASELIHNLKPQNEDYEIKPSSVIYDMFDYKNDEKDIRIMLDCLIKIFGKTDLLDYSGRFQDKLIKILSDEELTVFYALKLRGHTCDYIDYIKALEYDTKCKYNGSVFESLYDEFCENENMEGQFAMLSLMLNFADLVQKYDIISNLEKIISSFIVDEYDNGQSFLKEFIDFDINNDNINKLDNIIKNRFCAYVESNLYTKIIAFIIIKNKNNTSEFLEKYALLLLYKKAFDTKIKGREILPLDPKGFDNETKNNIKCFIEKYPNHKLTIHLSLVNDILKDLIKWNMISLDEYLEYISQNELSNFWLEFFAEKTDIISNKGNFGVHFDKSLKLKKILNLSKYFKENNELQNRVKLVEIICDSEEYDFEKNIIECSKFIDKYKVTKEYSLSVVSKVDTFLEKLVKKELKAENYEKELFIAISKIIANEDFFEYCIENYSDNSILEKSLILLATGSEEKYLDAFLIINDTSKSQLNVVTHIYRKYTILAEKLLEQLKSKKLADRKNAFNILKTAYKKTYLDQIKDAFKIEKNEKLKDDMEIFIEINI